ncbi:PREDICTED: leukocyte surface antigen CD53-like isoform X2 [Wasmannia auropunctata]|uniref:leukocyte surface antigen CD53-like isoform X2 n=1 Tax=Wasmannia auropunctata TaxID=64793 RepID=UPI0005EDE47A|nr:PREDICTED: leukocyte surface antigen CD53-like isoform X2 [Wasmannia auropunctata]
MNWRKFWLGVMGEKGTEMETDTDDDEVTETDETMSTEKSSKNIGTSPSNLFYKWLPEKCLKFCFLLLNSVALLAGVFVSLVTFTGIIGIAMKREYLMIFYLMCQSIALCAVFVYLTMSFPFFDEITRKTRDDMIDSMKSYQSSNRATEAWDNTHRYLKCCGIRSSKDWLDHQKNIPQSCCSAPIKQCLNITEDVSYKSGCLREAIMLLKSHVQTASISTLIIFPLLLISVLLAFGLRKGLKTNRLTRDEAIYS